MCPFPEGAGKWTVSSKGGGQPGWRPDGKGLFYSELSTGTLIAVPVSTQPRFSLGQPTRLFQHPHLKVERSTKYDAVRPAHVVGVSNDPLGSPPRRAADGPATTVARPELSRRKGF